jgi:hypothetical protein
MYRHVVIYGMLALTATSGVVTRLPHPMKVTLRVASNNDHTRPRIRTRNYSEEVDSVIETHQPRAMAVVFLGHRVAV